MEIDSEVKLSWRRGTGGVGGEVASMRVHSFVPSDTASSMYERAQPREINMLASVTLTNKEDILHGKPERNLNVVFTIDSRNRKPKSQNENESDIEGETDFQN